MEPTNRLDNPVQDANSCNIVGRPDMDHAPDTAPAGGRQTAKIIILCTGRILASGPDRPP